VVGLSDQGYAAWAGTSGVNTAEIARQIAGNGGLQSKLSSTRRDAINATNSFAPGAPPPIRADGSLPANYIPTKAEASASEAAQEAFKSAKAIDDARDKDHKALQAYLSDARSGADKSVHNEIKNAYTSNDLYRQAVDHAVKNGAPVPPVFKPKTDPLIQGEVFIPGNDRSIE
jgi:hypothetical protein